MTQSGHQSEVELELEDGHRFRIAFGGSAAPLVTDEPFPLGHGEGPNPIQLLAAAIGNCLASSLLHCARRSHFEPSELTATVEVTTARNAEGRLRVARVDVRLAPELDQVSRVRMTRCLGLFESFCTVTESVRQGFPVNVLVEPVPEELQREPISPIGRAPGLVDSKPLAFDQR